MGKNTHYIAALEAEIDTLSRRVAHLTDRVRALENPPAPPPPEPSLVDQARRQAAAWGDRVLEGLGL